MVGGCPAGMGIIGPRGSDEDLLQLSLQVMDILKEPAAGDA